MFENDVAKSYRRGLVRAEICDIVHINNDIVEYSQSPRNENCYFAIWLSVDDVYFMDYNIYLIVTDGNKWAEVVSRRLMCYPSIILNYNDRNIILKTIDRYLASFC